MQKAPSATKVVNSRLAVAGFMSKVNISPSKLLEIARSVSGCIALWDIIIILFLGWFLLPLVEMSYNSGLKDSRKKSFRETYLYYAVDCVSQMVKIVVIVYIADVNYIILRGLGFDIGQTMNLGATVGKVAYTIWTVRQLKTFKRYILSKAVDRSPNKLGKYVLYDHLSDFFVYVSAAMFICDILSVEVGTGLTSVFAFGSMGTFAFSMGSKDLCAQLLSGLVISTSDKFLVGDSIKLGDGTAGIVDKIGWFDTVIRGEVLETSDFYVDDLFNVTLNKNLAGYDNICIKIPNSQLSNQRVSNISKVEMCQVKQTLYFAQEDYKKITQLLDCIKNEIKEACPHLIINGKRPFRAYWTSFLEERLEVFVDCHFTLPPSGDAYWGNRQQMMQAIAMAMEKCEMTQALPSSAVRHITN